MTVPDHPSSGISGKSTSLMPGLTRTLSPTWNRGLIDRFFLRVMRHSSVSLPRHRVVGSNRMRHADVETSASRDRKRQNAKGQPMVRFTPAQQLKDKYHVFGHFYSVRVAATKV